MVCFCLYQFTTQLLWTLSVVFMGFMLTQTYPAVQLPSDQVEAFQPRTVTTGVAMFVFTLGWSLANGWIIYQCATNPSNVVSRFLSAKVFQPFSRLSFSFYMVHLMNLWFNTYQARTPIYVTGFTGLWQLVAIVLLQTYLWAFFLYLTLDAPFVNLTKEFIDLKSNKTISNKTANNNDAEDVINNNNNIKKIN